VTAGPRPAAVIFDNDGTFLETDGAWTRAEQTLFARRGMVFGEEHRHGLLGSSFEMAARHLERFLGRPGDGGALMAELVELVYVEIEREVPLMPGAGELVGGLRDAGVPIAMATNAARDFALKALRRAGHGDTFGVLVSAEDVPAAKPAPDPFLAAAARLDVDPAGCVVLEDSPTGVRAGRAAGMTVVGVTAQPGVVLAEAHHVHRTLEDPVLWARLGLAPPRG